MPAFELSIINNYFPEFENEITIKIKEWILKVLVIGSGGREHAICGIINKKIDKIYCAPGNAGISNIAEIVNIKTDNLEGLVNFAKKENIDFTIVGPEQPLSLGIVDLFRENNLLVFGPSKYASQLESSKEFSKLFMKRNNIPTVHLNHLLTMRMQEVI